MDPDQAVELWKQFKEDQPELALGLSVLPVSGQISAATEYYGAMKEGDTKGAVLAALQFIPVVGKGMRSLGSAAAHSDEAARFEPLLEKLSAAKIGRNGETVADLANAAYARAHQGAAEVASGALSGVLNLGEYIGSRISSARAAFDDGFKSVRGSDNDQPWHPGMQMNEDFRKVR